MAVPIMAVLKVAAKVAKVAGKAIVQGLKISIKGGKTAGKVAVAVKKAVDATVSVMKAHPVLTNTLVSALAGAATSTAVETWLAEKGVKTDEVQAYMNGISELKDFVSDIKNIDDFVTLTPPSDKKVKDPDPNKSNHSPWWASEDEKVASRSSTSPSQSSQIPSLDDILVRQYIYHFDQNKLKESNSVMYNQLAQVVAAYYKGLSLEVPTTEELKRVAGNMVNALTNSWLALCGLVALRRYQSGWRAPINNQPGAAGLILGEYDNTFRGYYDKVDDLDDLLDVPDNWSSVVQGIVNLPGTSNTPTLTTFPKYTTSGFETGVSAYEITPGVGTTAANRDGFYGSNISNKQWMDLVAAIKTLPITQYAANFADYLFGGVFINKNSKYGTNRDAVIFHPEVSVSVDRNNLEFGTTMYNEILRYIEYAEQAINSDRSIQTIFNYMGLYTPLGEARAYDSKNTGVNADKDWRSNPFVRDPESKTIIVRDFDESLYKALINADYTFNCRVIFPINGQNIAKQVSCVSYAATSKHLYWDRQSEFVPGKVYDMKAKWDMLKAGEVASALKFMNTAHLVPSYTMQFNTAGAAIKGKFRVPSMGAFVGTSTSQPAGLFGYMLEITDPNNLIRLNCQPMQIWKFDDFDLLDVVNCKYADMDNRKIPTSAAREQTPCGVIDSDYIPTYVEDLNTVYDWQYWHLLTGNVQLKPMIDLLQRIEVSAAGRI